MKFRPLHDRVVVKRVEEEGKTKGGIIIPDTAKEKPKQGKVLAVGPGGRDTNGKLIPVDVKVGDIVLFTQWGGNEIKIDGKEFTGFLVEKGTPGLTLGAEEDKMGIKGSSTRQVFFENCKILVDFNGT